MKLVIRTVVFQFICVIFFGLIYLSFKNHFLRDPAYTTNKKSDPESGESHLIILNQFRNLIRKELGLTQIDFKSYPFENNSYFLYVGCAKENKHAKHNQTAELK
jgi:hypothetical protein